MLPPALGLGQSGAIQMQKKQEWLQGGGEYIFTVPAHSGPSRAVGAGAICREKLGH